MKNELRYVSNIYGVVNMIQMQSLLISDDNCRYEAVASSSGHRLIWWGGCDVNLQ